MENGSIVVTLVRLDSDLDESILPGTDATIIGADPNFVGLWLCQSDSGRFWANESQIALRDEPL